MMIGSHCEKCAFILDILEKSSSIYIVNIIVVWEDFPPFLHCSTHAKAIGAGANGLNDGQTQA